MWSEAGPKLRCGCNFVRGKMTCIVPSLMCWFSPFVLRLRGAGFTPEALRVRSVQIDQELRGH